MHDPATAEVWQTVFGKDFGGMAQGDNKRGKKGTNSIFVMTHAEVKLIPKPKQSHMLALLLISILKRRTHTGFVSQLAEISLIIRENCLRAWQT